MKKLIYIDRDEDYAIILCKDGHKGIAVQTIQYVDRDVPGYDKQMVTERATHVIDTNIINFISANSGGQLNDFPKEVAKAIVKSKSFLAKIKEMNKSIDGVLTNYLSAHKDLNTDE